MMEPPHPDPLLHKHVEERVKTESPKKLDALFRRSQWTAYLTNRMKECTLPPVKSVKMNYFGLAGLLRRPSQLPPGRRAL